MLFKEKDIKVGQHFIYNENAGEKLYRKYKGIVVEVKEIYSDNNAEYFNNPIFVKLEVIVPNLFQVIGNQHIRSITRFSRYDWFDRADNIQLRIL